MITDERDGLLVPDGDVDALASALSRLMEDESLRKELGDAAALSAQRFSSSRVMELWDDVVRTALSPTKS
jgi:glycosyltransferase involved in cell wall biosynthesis